MFRCLKMTTGEKNLRYTSVTIIKFIYNQSFGVFYYVALDTDFFFKLM